MLASACGCGARGRSRRNKCRFCWFTRSSMPLASARVIACWIMEAWTGTFAASSSHHVHGFVWVVVTQWCDGVPGGVVFEPLVREDVAKESGSLGAADG